MMMNVQEGGSVERAMLIGREGILRVLRTGVATVGLVAVAAGAAAASAPRQAPVATGTVSGQVADQTGGVLPGAAVMIRHAGTGQARTTTSDAQGRFEVTGLTAGVYDLTVSLSGFGAVERRGVTVAAGRSVVDVTMRIATAQQATVIGELISATKMATPDLQIPASVSSVSQARLTEQHATTLHEAMNNVAGATTHRDAGAIEMFFLRGFDSTGNGLLLTDGAYEPRTGINQTYNIDRMEVVRGPIGFLYGGNALAGAVNMVRKRPDAGNFAHLTMIGGSHGSAYSTADLNRSSADGRRRVRLNGMYQTADNYRDDKEGTAWAINPSATVAIGARTWLNLDVETQSTTGKIDSGIPVVLGAVADVPRTRSYQTPFDEFGQDTTRVRLNLDHVVSPRLTLRNKAYYTYQDWTNAGTLFFGAIPDGTGGGFLIRAFGDLNQKVKVGGNQFDAELRVDTGSVSHNITAGLEYQRLTVNADLSYGLLPFIDLKNPVETANLPVTPIPGTSLTLDLDTRTLAPYVIDTMRFSDRLHLSVGGRIDFLDQKNAVTGFTQKENEFSPFVGLVVAPSGRLSLYANYGEVFNPISLAVASGEPKPEKGAGMEVGLKSRALDGRVRTSVAVYSLNKDNISIVDQTGIVAQLGDQESKGMEVEISAGPAAGLNLTFVYGYTDSVLTRFTQVDAATGMIADRSGNVPAWVPTHVVNAWVSRTFQNGLMVAAGARHVSERFMNEANDFAVPGYTTLDGNVTYSRGRWQGVVHLKNLTGSEYETRSVNQMAVLPAPGRTISAGLHLRF
jgi:TonB-dependent siderophore receptor